jgi:hypothetical protein
VPLDFWSREHIEYLASQEIVKGYPDGSYRPSQQVTRAQMAVYVAQGFGLAHRMADAIWLGTGTSNPWVDPSTSEVAMTDMLAELDAHGIRRLFVNVGFVNGDATDVFGYSAMSEEGIARFLQAVASYEAENAGTEFELLAGLCVASGEAIGDWPACSTDLQVVRERIAELAAGMLQVTPTGDQPRSFDGVHFDIEPAGGEDLFERLLAIVAEARLRCGEAELSLAAPRLQSDWDMWPQESRWCWTEEQYRTAADSVDELAPMVYVAPDSVAYGFDLAEYQSYVSDQVVRTLSAVSGAEVSVAIGVPTYWPSDPGHDERMDLLNTIGAVASAVVSLQDQGELAALRRLAGVALFRYELLAGQPQLWEDYEELWGTALD